MSALIPPGTGPRTFHCVDERNAAVARGLMDSSAALTTRHEFSTFEIPSDAQAYKRQLVEIYGRTDWVSESRFCWPRQKVNATWLVNEILCYLEDLEEPPILHWLARDEVAKYHALDGNKIVRAYGIGERRFDTLAKMLMTDPDSKRAVVSFWDRNYVEPAAETPCALATQFLLRDGWLMSINTYRSHDFFAGVRTDAIRCALAQQLLGNLVGQNGWMAPIGFAEGSIHYYPSKNTPESLKRVADWMEPGTHAIERSIMAFADKDSVTGGPFEVLILARLAYYGSDAALLDLQLCDQFFFRLLQDVWRERGLTP